MTPSLSGHVGGLTRGKSAAEALPDHVVVHARHDPPWATAAAVEEALVGEEGLRRAAHLLRATVHDLRRGSTDADVRWRERWRRAEPGRAVVIAQAEDLDPETARFLLRDTTGLGHPVHLVFTHLPTRGPALELADRLGLRAPPLQPVKLPDAPDVRLVLRAAAGLGSPFDAAAVAALLDLPTLRVLEQLQRAVDGGFPLADHGGGSLSMPDEARWALAEGLLPSLQEAWQAQRRDECPAPAPDEPTPDDEPRLATPEPGEPEQRVRSARQAVEEARGGDDRRQRGLAQLELARSLRARPGLGVALTEPIEAARHAVELLATAEVHKRAAARVTLAHLLLEHGAPGALDEALDEVVAASRELTAAGDPQGAASLLNDQAEVWLKLGDTVRAAHLLEAAEGGLEGRTDAMAVVERAETDHLLARLPLYAPARPGHASDALAAALERLERAEAVYLRVGWVDRQAHALDTRGRLLARLGRVDEAAQVLQQAAATYRQLGDGLGLARVTEGLATLWAQRGHTRRALALLEQSLVLNLAAASPAGLAYVRRAMEHLPEGPQRATLEARLADAEASVGRVHLPPEVR